MKVVINRCYGGFGISDQAAEILAGLRGIALDQVHRYKGYAATRGILRNDPLLIQVVESLGSKAASDSLAKLEIVEIPDGVDWEISEYDGMESVHESHRSWP